MSKQERKQKIAALQQRVAGLESAIHPLLMAGPNLLDQMGMLNEMFVATVANAADTELDNFTARRFSPFFLAMNETLTNLYRIPDIRMASQADPFD
jgi:hypothetical protein